MPDPAPETDRELLDRLLPGWELHDVTGGCARVVSGYINGDWFMDRASAVSTVATALRAILARDRETRGEAEAKPEAPVLRRWPVLTMFFGKEDWITANDGTIWRHGDAAIGEPCWVRAPNLPQPGEDGGA